MILQVSAAEAEGNRRASVGAEAVQSAFTDYIGSALHVRTGNEAPPLPQAFLIEKPAGTSTRLHFHDEDQFQIFLEGEGRVGPETVIAPAVHFANFHTAYGPIVAGDRGMSWVTVRDVADEGAWYLPESRKHAAKAVSRRNISMNLAETAEAGLQAVMPPTEDGLGIWRLNLGPDESVTADELPAFPADVGGRFFVVRSGALRGTAASLGKRSIVYATAGEPLSLVAGGNGADILIVQFPRDRRCRSRGV